MMGWFTLRRAACALGLLALPAFAQIALDPELLRQDSAGLPPVDAWAVEIQQGSVAATLAKFCDEVTFRAEVSDALDAEAMARVEAVQGRNESLEVRKATVERMRLYDGLPRAYLKSVGLVGATKAQVCAVARAEIAAGSALGKLLAVAP